MLRGRVPRRAAWSLAAPNAFAGAQASKRVTPCLNASKGVVPFLQRTQARFFNPSNPSKRVFPFLGFLDFLQALTKEGVACA
jgi:hypothetical protein